MNDDAVLEQMFELTQSYQQNVRSIMNVYDQMLLNINSLTSRRRLRRNLFPSTDTSTTTTGVNIWSSTPSRRARRRPVPPPPSRPTTSYLYEFPMDLENVIVTPTRTQINAALEHIQYNSSITQDCDPIDLLPFTTDENIVRIRHCGHCFRETNLNTWFNSSVHCPLCRVDIRDSISSNN